MTEQLPFLALQFAHLLKPAENSAIQTENTNFNRILQHATVHLEECHVLTEQIKLENVASVQVTFSFSPCFKHRIQFTLKAMPTLLSATRQVESVFNQVDQLQVESLGRTLLLEVCICSQSFIWMSSSQSLI